MKSLTQRHAVDDMDDLARLASVGHNHTPLVGAKTQPVIVRAEHHS